MALASSNFVSTMPKIIILELARKNQTDIGAGDVKKQKLEADIVPGLYFVEFDRGKHPPKLFSYRRHVLNRSPFARDWLAYAIHDSQILLDDIRIVAEPSRVRLGYTIAIREESGAISCGYVVANKTIIQSPQILYIFADLGFILQFPLFMLVFIMISIPILCCQNKFKKEKVREDIVQEQIPKTKSKIRNMLNHVSLPAFASNIQSQEALKEMISPSEDAPRSSLVPVLELNNLDSPKSDPKDAPFSEEIMTPRTTDAADPVVGATAFMQVMGHKMAKHRSARTFSKSTNQCLDMFRSLVVVTPKSLIESCGTDSYFFLSFSRFLNGMVFLAALAAIPSLITNSLSTNFKYYLDYAALTVSAIQEWSPLFIVHLFTILVYVVLFIIIRACMARLSTRVATQNLFKGTIGVLKVSGIPRVENYQSKLEQFFKSISPEHFVQVSCINLFEELTKLSKDLHRVQTLVDNNTENSWIRSCCCFRKKVSHEDLLARQQKIREQIANLRGEYKPEFSGVAFVTFSNMSFAEITVDSFANKAWKKQTKKDNELFAELQADTWHVRMAPDYNDVIWQNIGFPYLTKMKRSLIGYGVFLVMLAGIYLVTLAISIFWLYRELFKNTTNEWAKRNFPIIRETKEVQIGYLYLQPVDLFNELLNLLPQMVALVNQLIPIVLNSVIKYERHDNRTSTRQKWIANIIFYMFLNTIILPYLLKYIFYLLFFKLYGEAPFDAFHYFYNVVGIEILRFILAQSLELAIQFVQMMGSLFYKGYISRPSYGYEGNYGFRITLMFVVLFYGPLTPIVPIGVFFYLIVMYYLDKWLIMYLCKPNPDSDGRFIFSMHRNTTLYLLVFPLFIMALTLDHLIPYMVIIVPISFVMIIAGLLITWLCHRNWKRAAPLQVCHSDVILQALQDELPEEVAETPRSAVTTNVFAPILLAPAKKLQDLIFVSSESESQSTDEGAELRKQLQAKHRARIRKEARRIANLYRHPLQQYYETGTLSELALDFIKQV